MLRRWIALAAAGALAAGALFLDASPRPERAAIGGEVTWVVAPGTRVEEGGALVRVASLAGGEAVAARAKGRGVVRDVAVAVGERVRAGALVARVRRE